MPRSKYYTPDEVSAHNSAADLWVSFVGKVCDLTPLVREHRGSYCACAGTKKYVKKNDFVRSQKETSSFQVIFCCCQLLNAQERISATGSTPKRKT